MNAQRWIAIAVLAMATVLAGCERTFRDMYDQPRYKPLAASPVWSDGRSSRPPVAGTIAYSEGTAAGTSSGRLGVVEPAPAPQAIDTVREDLRAQASSALALPAPTAVLLARGRERFDIDCAPCHSIAGDGDGWVARRGFPHPPSFHIARLRDASDAHFYAVITDGYGAMYSYATRVTPKDRLAIIAYIRALQLSQHAPLSAVPEDERTRLESQSAVAAPAGGTR